MPTTEVLFYRDSGGSAPAWDWLRDLNAGGVHDKKVFNKCIARITRLREMVTGSTGPRRGR